MPKKLTSIKFTELEMSLPPVSFDFRSAVKKVK